MRVQRIDGRPNTPPFRASAVLALLVLSACSSPASTAAGDTEVDSKHLTSTGVTVFGDARLGVAFD
jgi:hypothetical protein